MFAQYRAMRAAFRSVHFSAVRCLLIVCLFTLPYQRAQRCSRMRRGGE